MYKYGTSQCPWYDSLMNFWTLCLVLLSSISVYASSIVNNNNEPAYTVKSESDVHPIISHVPFTYEYSRAKGTEPIILANSSSCKTSLVPKTT